MDTKDWISSVCSIVTAITAIITVVITVTDKKKTAKRFKPHEHKRKR